MMEDRHAENQRDSANFPATQRATLWTERTLPTRLVVRSGGWCVSPFGSLLVSSPSRLLMPLKKIKRHFTYILIKHAF